MDVRDRLTRWALQRPHVLLVAAPVGTTLRWRVETELGRRRWPAASSPADADILLTLAQIGDLDDAADVLWGQVPPPRLRVHIDSGDDISRVLDDAARALSERPAREPAEPRPLDAGDGDGDIAGLPMAGGGPDRDGMELDALTVHLGPVLPGWPAGLVVSATLQGDVMTDVGARVLGPTVGDPRPDPTLVALDALERVLIVSGWTAAAREAARLRGVLAGDGPPTADAVRRVRALVGAVRRSRALGWSLRDLRGTDERVQRWCDVVEQGVAGRPGAAALPAYVPLTDVPELLDGLDVGSARIAVAALPLALTSRDRAAQS